jgi:hypothetical protein
MNAGVDETYQAAIRLEADLSVDEYVKAMRTSTRTGGDVAIASFVNIHKGVRIVTCLKTRDTQQLYDGEGIFQPISAHGDESATCKVNLLWTEGGLGHYDLLVPVVSFSSPKKPRLKETRKN